MCIHKIWFQDHEQFTSKIKNPIPKDRRLSLQQKSRSLLRRPENEDQTPNVPLYLSPNETNRRGEHISVTTSATQTLDRSASRENIILTKEWILEHNSILRRLLI